MRTLTFYFDVISPYASLAFERLPQALEGLSHHVHYVPVLFAGMLKHHGQLGPAEVAPKRDWTYRQVSWLAHQAGLDWALPAQHPFNPLPVLRLAQACAESGHTNRWVTETVLRHVWQGGADPNDPARLQALQARLMDHMAQREQPWRDPDGADVKAELRAQTDAAIAQGVFGVPSVVLDGRVFWGQDALPMLRACMAGDAWFASSAWDGAPKRPAAVQRTR